MQDLSYTPMENAFREFVIATSSNDTTAETIQSARRIFFAGAAAVVSVVDDKPRVISAIREELIDFTEHLEVVGQ